MAGPQITNNTPFWAGDLYAADEHGQPIVTVLVRATYRIDLSGALILSSEQLPAQLVGEHTGDSELSSYRYEPETAFVKLGTDIVLIGHAQAPTSETVVLDVGLKVGKMQKIVRVYGDRFWVKTRGSVLATRPQPFVRIPLIYERAFGGWDKAHKDATHWTFDPRNPVGVGYGDPLKYAEEGKVRMPNIEDPERPIRRYGEPAEPAGFGFVSPSWQPRAALAGTYDAAWEQNRKPLLPMDFDRRFFNSASRGLVSADYLNGNEDVIIMNASPIPRLRFLLPGVPPPACTIRLNDGSVEKPQLNLDTLIVNTDDMLVILIWRSLTSLATGAHDVASINLEMTSSQSAAIRRAL